MTEAHLLTSAQLARVSYFLDDAWVVDDDVESQANLERLLAEIESSAELHLCAMYFNWDGGCEELRRLIRHPRCDRGTALGVFWLGQPDWHYGRRKADLSEDQLAVRSLLVEIEEAYCGTGFASETIRLDPAQMNGEDLTADARARDSWDRVIPSVLFEPSPGSPVDLRPPGAW